ncbi:cysteine--tRNA ligase [Prevotella histicola]|jgi:cysteine--tRNA ligase|uniref:cysteine--tRNA ligase n=1 Tax=Prevotella histicola TaxID=470565 RepID=UPI001CAE503E|nr:cysteine--tRNA ligase [Prevotella histicola]MBF1391182.1 cysteine--tRNA ligase [Prevotella histicola]MBF1402348.1 cysteine--tRNA ligase [Prevotella histicola]MBF1418365.1 cysteine--tRNA ligase [Prevotella histicola]
MQDLVIYNTLHRKKELFQPIAAPNVGMYVCGPTVYGDPHLGHARPAITFDILFRYLKHIGYKVRYVRNITDVGHLEHDADEGDDKIEKKARLEQLEPMEIAQYYTNRYHDAMRALNVLPPSIEPHATGHIIEQEELVKEILANGYAYESNGSIYFDVEKYDKDHHYGILSGRNLSDMINNSRELAGVGEKHNQVDFALWKRAMPEHIMRWPSPWSNGFPGWHCECTAMGRKYLGDHFDIHGGGMDLIFPHHECEIAQAVASQGDQMVKYWMHNNMITINGQKMGKSLGNFITLEQFFTGKHDTLSQAYSPMTIRFFILSAHYRGTVDFSNEALQAAEKGYERLMNGIEDLARIQPSAASDENTKKFVAELRQKCYDAMNDDLMTPAVISNLFEACHLVNTIVDHKAQISADDLQELTDTMKLFAFDILGLQNERGANNDAREEAYGKVVDMVLDLRAKAKAEKNWAVSDQIRDSLAAAGFQVKDTKDGVTWKLDR